MLGSEPNISTSELESFAQTRYELMHEETVWSRSIREFVIRLIAPSSSTSSNLVTVTNGSSTVTSAGTPFTTSPSMVGYQIRIGAEPHYYFIDSVTSTSEIELGDGEGNTVNWDRDTDTESGWTIFQHRYALPADCEDVIVLSDDHRDLEEVDGGRHEIDRIDPNRSQSATRPDRWWHDGENSSNVREIGIWGHPASVSLLHGQCAKIAQTLNSSTVIDVPVPVLVYGTAADAASMMVAKEATDMWVRLSSFYNRMYLQALEVAIEKDNQRKSRARSISRDSRNPLARDHSYFTNHFSGVF